MKAAGPLFFAITLLLDGCAKPKSEPTTASSSSSSSSSSSPSASSASAQPVVPATMASAEPKPPTPWGRADDKDPPGSAWGRTDEVIEIVYGGESSKSVHARPDSAVTLVLPEKEGAKWTLAEADKGLEPPKENVHASNLTAYATQHDFKWSTTPLKSGRTYKARLTNAKESREFTFTINVN